MSESDPPVRDQLRTSLPEDLRIWPLTYDTLDQNDQNPLSFLGSGPPITPEGFAANGWDARLVGTISTGGALAPASLHCYARLDAERRNGTRDLIVSLVTATTDQPKLELAAVPDPADASQTTLAFRSYGSSNIVEYLNRPQWRFEFRFPEKITGTTLGWPAPQGLCFIDSNTLLLAAHREDVRTVLYQVDVPSGEYTGRCSSTEYVHLNSMHRRDNGEVWANCFVTSLGQNRMIHIDLATSFSTGELTASELWETTGLTPSIAFATINGTEYVLCQQWATTGTPYLYVFSPSQMSAPVTAADRIKRFALGTYIQDVCFRASDGLLYASRNRRSGDGSNKGWIESFDIGSAIASLADGSNLSPLASFPHASCLSEGIEFRPGDDRLWASTEGLLTVADKASHVAVWSSSVPPVPEENRYLFDFLGVTQQVEIRINGRLALERALTPSIAPTRLAIGGPPAASAGWNTGFMSSGRVREVALKDAPFTLAEITSLEAGDYEPNELFELSVPIVNPDGESGTTGWTDELSGTLGIRVAGPPPFAGSGYFVGGGAADERARQRFDFSTLGVAPASFSSLWAFVEWQQASWDAASDPGGVGIRTLDSTPAQIALLPAGEAVVTPAQSWRARCHFASLNGAAGFDLVQHRTRTVGTNVDCYIDAIRMKIYGRPTP